MTLQATPSNRPRSTTPERVEAAAPTVAPLVDVHENAHELLLLADVPGATRESVEVHIDKGQLTLAARRAHLAGAAPVFDYRRVFAVPSGIDASKIEAVLSNGVLKVRLPKSEALRPRRIEVKAS